MRAARLAQPLLIHTLTGLRFIRGNDAAVPHDVQQIALEGDQRLRNIRNGDFPVHARPRAVGREHADEEPARDAIAGMQRGIQVHGHEVPVAGAGQLTARQMDAEAAFAVLRADLEQAKPDVLIVVANLLLSLRGAGIVPRPLRQTVGCGRLSGARADGAGARADRHPEA